MLRLSLVKCNILAKLSSFIEREIKKESVTERVFDFGTLLCYLFSREIRADRFIWRSISKQFLVELVPSL